MLRTQLSSVSCPKANLPSLPANSEAGANMGTKGSHGGRRVSRLARGLITSSQSSVGSIRVEPGSAASEEAPVWHLEGRGSDPSARAGTIAIRLLAEEASPSQAETSALRGDMERISGFDVRGKSVVPSLLRETDDQRDRWPGRRPFEKTGLIGTSPCGES